MSAFEGKSREETMENEKGRPVDLVPELQGLNLRADEVEDKGRVDDCEVSEQEEDKLAGKKPAEEKQEDANEKPSSKSCRRVLDILAAIDWNPATDPGYHKVGENWSSARSWAAFLELSRAVLRGEATCTPWYGPLNAETSFLVPGLLRLHDYGFLSVDSQPNEHDLHGDGLWALARQREARHFFDLDQRNQFRQELKLRMEAKWEKQRSEQTWAEYRQRPYVSFVLPRAEKDVPLLAIKAFCLALHFHPAIVSSIATVFPKSRPLGTSIDQQRGDGCHIVSKLRLASTEEALAEAEWRTITTIWAFEREKDIESEYGTLGEYEAFRNAKPLAFQVAARFWEGNLDLLALLEQLAQESGLKPVYRGVTATPSIEETF